MTNRYTVINPDTLEAMRRAGHVAKLEARIEELEAALRRLIDYGMVSHQDLERARKALGEEENEES